MFFKIYITQQHQQGNMCGFMLLTSTDNLRLTVYEGLLITVETGIRESLLRYTVASTFRPVLLVFFGCAYVVLKQQDCVLVAKKFQIKLKAFNLSNLSILCQKTLVLND